MDAYRELLKAIEEKLLPKNTKKNFFFFLQELRFS